LSNADKYSPEGLPIEMYAALDDSDRLIISVLDRGRGVSPKEIKDIFQRFYRSSRTATRTSGIGLGLTICKRLVEAQGGQIWARPREGGGLEVHFTLPIYREEGKL
jgi:signal transduction histidine kinase